MCPIKGITTVYRPNRIGKIHLGVKNVKQKADGTETSYPSEVDYFVLKDAPWLIPIYGEKPIELHVTLPSARFDKENFDSYTNRVFPQFLKRYKKSGLMCKGDGEVANAVTPEGLQEIPCPCDFLDKGECKRMGALRVRISEIASFNVVQIDTSSFNSIVGINSFLRDILEYCIVRSIDVSDVKLVLRRQETVTQRMEKGESKTSTHHTLVFDLDPRFYKSLDDVGVKALPQSKAPKPLELPPPTEADPEEFPGGIEYARQPGDDEGNGPPPPPLTGKEMFEARLEELKRVGGILSKDEIKGNKTLKTDGGFRKAADYYERRIVDIRAAKGCTEG